MQDSSRRRSPSGARRAAPRRRRFDTARAGLLAAAALLLAAAPVAAARFAAVQEAEGTHYRCLGAGSRKVLGFKVYAVSFCLDSQKAPGVIRDYVAGTWPGKHGHELEKALSRDQRFFDALGAAPTDKLVMLRFERDIPRKKLSDAFRDSLLKVMPAANAQKLAEALSFDVKEGEVALLFSRGDDLVMQLQGRRQVIADDAIVTGQLWKVWLGNDTPTPNLKSSIASLAPGLL